MIGECTKSTNQTRPVLNMSNGYWCDGWKKVNIFLSSVIELVITKWITAEFPSATEILKHCIAYFHSFDFLETLEGTINGIHV